MPATRRILDFLLAFTLIATSASAFAQVVISTVPVGYFPYGVAVNAVTNKIYTVNNGDGTLTVINGTTLATQTVTVGSSPVQVAVNSVTNKIYVTNYCGSDPNCSGGSNGTMTVIDGSTLATQTVTVGIRPFGVAINSVSNKIYVVNYGSGYCSSGSGNGTVTVIDGATLSTHSVVVGVCPNGVAINSTTNKIYVANTCGNDSSCSGSSPGTVTIIDGLTLGTQTVNVDYYPYDMDVNSATNKVYVDNAFCSGCGDDGTVTVIDGTTLSTQRVLVGFSPYDVRVNSATNKIYVPNHCGNDPNCGSTGTVTVIDGTTLSTSTVAVGADPQQAAVDSATNKVYVTNNCGNDPNCATAGTVTAIDGATLSTTPVAVGDYPYFLAVNPSTNTVYVPSRDDNTVSVIGGEAKLQLVAVTPCRLLDTRPQYGGGGPIPGGSTAAFNLPQLAQAKGCANLSSAAAYSLNVAVVPRRIFRLSHDLACTGSSDRW